MLKYTCCFLRRENTINSKYFFTPLCFVFFSKVFALLTYEIALYLYKLLFAYYAIFFLSFQRWLIFSRAILAFSSVTNTCCILTVEWEIHMIINNDILQNIDSVVYFYAWNNVAYTFWVFYWNVLPHCSFNIWIENKFLFFFLNLCTEWANSKFFTFCRSVANRFLFFLIALVLCRDKIFVHCFEFLWLFLPLERIFFPTVVKKYM